MRVRVGMLAASILLALAAQAGATGIYGTVDMTYLNDNWFNQAGVEPPIARIEAPGSGSVADGHRVYVGRSNFHVDSATGGASNPLNSYVGEDITAYCVDIYAWINYNTPATWDVEPLSSAPTAPASSTMGDVKAGILAELADLYMGQVTTRTEAAAFQASVWEIVNENLPSNPVNGQSLGYSLGTGVFQMDDWNDGGDAALQANAWLGSLTWPGADPEGSFSLLNLSTQDFGFLVPGTNSPPVPEPVTMFSAFLAIGGLGAYVRRRTKATAAK